MLEWLYSSAARAPLRRMSLVWDDDGKRTSELIDTKVCIKRLYNDRFRMGGGSG